MHKVTTNSLKGENNKNTIIQDINTPLVAMHISPKQKINEEIPALNDTSDQINIINIYRAFYLRTPGYAFLSSAHRTFKSRPYVGAQN